MLTERDIKQLAKSYNGQVPSNTRHMVGEAFRSLQWGYANLDGERKSLVEEDFAKLQELKDDIVQLNEDALYELFRHHEKPLFHFALDKDVLSYVVSFDRTLARNDISRGEWDGKQYSMESIATRPVYQQFYVLLPDLSAEEREKLSSLRGDIRQLDLGSIQSSFLGALNNITSFSDPFRRQEQLDFFLDGDVLRWERQYKRYLQAPEARGNLFYVLSLLGCDERQSLLRIGPYIETIGNGSIQAHFLHGLWWSTSSPGNLSFFLDGNNEAIDYITGYKPFLPSQPARDNFCLALAHLSEASRAKLWNLRKEIMALGEIGQDNYMRNLHITSQGTYENDRYGALAAAAQENLLDLSVVNAGTPFFTGNVKGTMASRVFDVLPWLSPEERQSLVTIHRELRSIQRPSNFLEILKGGPHLNKYAGDQEPTTPDARAFLLRKGLVSYHVTLGKDNSCNRFLEVIVTLSPEQREKLWNAREELRGVGDDLTQTNVLSHIRFLRGRGENAIVNALLEKDVLQEMKGMNSAQHGAFMEKVEQTHKDIDDLRNLLKGRSSVSRGYRPVDQQKLRRHVTDGVGTKAIQAQAKACVKADEEAFQEALDSLSRNRVAQGRLARSWKLLDPILDIAKLKLTRVPSAIIPFLAHVQKIDLSKNDLSGVSKSEIHTFGEIKTLHVLNMQNCNLREFPQINCLQHCRMDLRGNYLIPLPMQEELRAHYGINIHLDDRQTQIGTYRDVQGFRWVQERGILPEMVEQRRKALVDINLYLSDTLPGTLLPSELNLAGRAVGKLPEGLFHIVATKALTNVSVASCQLAGTVDLSGLRDASKLTTLDISDNALTGDQDFSALKNCRMLRAIHAERNAISFLPNGIDCFPPGITLHLDGEKLEGIAKIEALVFNGLRSMGIHGAIDIGGETASSISRIGRVDTHTQTIEEVNRNIETLKRQQSLLPGELNNVERRWHTLQEMLQKQEDANLIHTYITLYGSPEMQRYYHNFRVFGSTLLHGSHALRNVSIRPDVQASTGSTPARLVATLLAQAGADLGSHLTKAQPTMNLPVGEFGKGLDFAVQFIEQRDFNEINNNIVAFIDREEVDTFMRSLSRAAAWSMEEKWQRERLLESASEVDRREGGSAGGSIKRLLGKAAKASQDITQKAVKASSEELAFVIATTSGKAASGREETMEQQRASEDVCSLIIGMAYGKPWPLEALQEIRKVSLEEKLRDGLAWFCSGKHRSEHPTQDDIIRSKPHLLVVDWSTEEKVNYLTKHLMLGTLDNTRSIADQRRQLHEQDTCIEDLRKGLKNEKYKRRNLTRALKEMDGFEHLSLSDSESETEMRHGPSGQMRTLPPVSTAPVGINVTCPEATSTTTEEANIGASTNDSVSSCFSANFGRMTSAEQVRAGYLTGSSGVSD